MLFFCHLEQFTHCTQVIAESLSEEEIGGLKELFKMIDTDNSGTITFDELKDGLKRVGSELTENEIQALMDAVSSLLVEFAHI
jgi:Ca2+-binding EF-hand superfamily protein